MAISQIADNNANRLIGTSGPDLLVGLGGDDTLNGVAGDDTLNGGAGVDRLQGAAGNDTFILDAAPGAANADVLVAFHSGADKVQLDGTVHANLGATGNFTAGDERFWASSSGTAHDASDRVLYNTRTGELWYDADGNGAGARQLIATLQGTRTLAATDIAVANGSGGEPGGGLAINGTPGEDFLTGTAGDDTINGLGGDDGLTGDPVDSAQHGDDVLSGGDGNDVLRGLGGDDTMLGGAGDDYFSITSAFLDFPDVYPGNDSIDGGAGIDQIGFSVEGVSSTAAVTIDLGAGTYSIADPRGQVTGTVINVERAQGSRFSDSIRGSDVANWVDGFAGDDTISGLGGNDTLGGSSGNDSIDGGAGNDVLMGDDPAFQGGAGVDRLNGGSGNDHFVFANAGDASADVVADFATGVDKLDLEDAVYTGVGAVGNFAAGDARFYSAAGATAGHDENDRVIYDTTTGNLYYDADGSGSGAAQLVATIQGHPAVAATDMAVI
jgi:serralysin